MIGPKTPKPTPADERRSYQQVTERDQNRCVRCGTYGIQRDHRKNRSQGGLTVVSNLQCLCPDCHAFKTVNPAWAVADGFAVPSYAHPELWPGWRVGVGWVQYLDSPVDGSWWRPITDSTASLLMGDA